MEHDATSHENRTNAERTNRVRSYRPNARINTARLNPVPREDSPVGLLKHKKKKTKTRQLGETDTPLSLHSSLATHTLQRSLLVKAQATSQTKHKRTVGKSTTNSNAAVSQIPRTNTPNRV